MSAYCLAFACISRLTHPSCGLLDPQWWLDYIRVPHQRQLRVRMTDLLPWTIYLTCGFLSQIHKRTGYHLRHPEINCIGHVILDNRYLYQKVQGFAVLLHGEVWPCLSKGVSSSP